MLVPVALADTLLRLAEHELYRPLWSELILSETTTAIEHVHPHLVDGRAEHRRQTPDAFLLDQLGLAPGAVVTALHQQAAATMRPAVTVETLLTHLYACGAPDFAAAARTQLWRA